MRICINGGHYIGEDPGAVGRLTTEADINRKLMIMVGDYLKIVGYKVLTVHEDSLSDIVYQCNEFNSDLFISIHCNAAENRSARGTETYCLFNGGRSEKLAKAIHNQLITSIPELVDRGTKTSNFYVLKNTVCPAVLVETAFISNQEDECLLTNQTDQFAKAIARGITDYIASI